MTDYSSTEPSTAGPRSPLFGTATFSTLSATQTPRSPSYLSSTQRSLTPTPSSYDSDDVSSGRQMRRINVSPTPSRSSYTYTYADEDSYADEHEVAASLNMIDDELDDAITSWSGGPSPYTSSTTPVDSSLTQTPLDFYSSSSTLLDRDRRVLSTISEHTENVSSRPVSFAQSAGQSGSRPVTLYSTASGEHRRSATLADILLPTSHVRASTEPDAREATPRREVIAAPGRVGQLVASFEQVSSPGYLQGHTRTVSAPSGPRSPSPYTSTSQAMPTLSFTNPSTGYGYGTTTGYTTTGYGSTTGYSGTAGYTYSSRPSSPTKSRSGSSVGSSMYSPPRGAPTSMSADSRLPPSTYTRSTTTGTGTGTYTTTTGYTGTATDTVTNTLSNTNTFTTLSGTITGTPTASSLRRPQTSPRSPLSSVRNIVAAWKERTPSLNKSSRAALSTSTSPPEAGGSGEGLFSMRRRAERGSQRLRGRAMGNRRGSGSEVSAGPSGPRSPRSGTATQSTPFDLSELGQLASVEGNQEPSRIGELWYLNVHGSEPYRWQRCQALLYPHMLLLSWIAPGGGRGIVTLDLLNCTEVRSAPSPTHREASDDVGTIAAQDQSREAVDQAEAELAQILSPFHLLYTDGVERLGAESPRERVRWVNAIWETLNRSVTAPDRSNTGSPAGSIRTIRSFVSSSSTRSGSASGSASTTYRPPFDSIPDMSDLHSLSGSSGVSRRRSLVSGHHTRTIDDSVVSGQTYIYPGDRRVIGPSRSSSLRRTTSLTDLDAAFDSALQRRREAQPGLGFAMGLVGLASDGSPVTVSSGPRLGRDVQITPPPSRPRSRVRPSSSESSSYISDEAFFSAPGSGGTRTQTSSFYSSSSFTHNLTSTADGTFTTKTAGLASDTLDLSSGSGTQIVPDTLSYRGTDSASMLGDSHSESTPYTTSSLSRSGGMRRHSRASTRSYSTTDYTHTDSISDKENTNSYTYGSRSTTPGRFTSEMSTLESYDYTASRSTSRTPTRSYTTSRTPSQLEDEPSEVEELEERALSSHSSEEYATAKSPATSYMSLPTIPSLVDYSTEYETAPKCPTEKSLTEFETAEVCETEPQSEYVTCDLCGSDILSEYNTAECHCLKAKTVEIESVEGEEEEEEEISIRVPSPIPTIPSSATGEEDLSSELEYEEVKPENIPLPLSTYSPSEISGISSPLMSEAPSPSTPEPPTPSLTETSSIPGPSDIGVPEPEISISVSTISTPTESSVTPTSSSELTPTIPSSTIGPQPSFASPSIPESMWAAETDESYESSMLRASPSVQSMALPEGLDTSFETSFLRPSASVMTSEASSLLTPITEESSVTPSVPIISTRSSSATPTPSTVSPLPSVPSPTPVSSERSVTSLTRTPSSVSTVSSVSMSSSIFYPRSLFEVPPPDFDDISTEPSLLSTAREPSERAPSPRGIPLPPSPSMSMSAPSVPISVSVTTPEGTTPSIHSLLETVPSVEGEPIRGTPPSHILTHDVNRILQYLYEINSMRTDVDHDIMNNIRDIRDELMDISDHIRAVPEPQPQPYPPIEHEEQPEPREVYEMEDAPPPVPEKEPSSVGTVESVRSQRLRDAPTPVVGPRLRPVEEPHRIAIPLTPPPMQARMSSPESISESMSFLSSHHSDDLSLLESESYPIQPGSPSWSSSSPSSSGSPTSVSSSVSARQRGVTQSLTVSDVSSESSVSRSASPLQMPDRGAVSPSLSSVSSGTARPIPAVTLSHLRDLLDGLRDQHHGLLDNQRSTHHMLGELLQRRAHDDVETRERVRRLEEMVQMLLDIAQRGPERAAPAPAPPPQPARSEVLESEVSSDSSSYLDRLQRFREEADRGRHDILPIHMPTPGRPGPSFDEQLAQILATGPAPAHHPIQPPPELVPLVYRPGPRGGRMRSPSPTFETDLPTRSASVPLVEPVRFEPRPRPVPRMARPARRPGAPPSTADSFVPPVIPTTGRPTSTRPDSIDFEREVRNLRAARQGAQPGAPPPGTFVPSTQRGTVPQRAPTAPPDLAGREARGGPDRWYTPRRPPTGEAPAGPAEPIIPPPGQYMADGGSAQGVPPAPTILQVPTFDDILALLRENRHAQVATIDQQREMMRYLRGLNEWLERDVRDRQDEMRSVTERIRELNNLVEQLMQGGRPAEGVQMQAPGVGVPPPPTIITSGPGMVQPPPPTVVMQPAPGQPLPPGFVPHGQMHAPVIPSPPEGYGAPGGFMPDVGGYSGPRIPMPVPQVPVIPRQDTGRRTHMRPPQHGDHDDEVFIPGPPSESEPSSSSSSGGLYSDGGEEQHPQFTIIPPPGHQRPVTDLHDPTVVPLPASRYESSRPSSPRSDRYEMQPTVIRDESHSPYQVPPPIHIHTDAPRVGSPRHPDLQQPTVIPPPPVVVTVPQHEGEGSQQMQHPPIIIQPPSMGAMHEIQEVVDIRILRIPKEMTAVDVEGQGLLLTSIYLAVALAPDRPLAMQYQDKLPLSLLPKLLQERVTDPHQWLSRRVAVAPAPALLTMIVVTMIEMAVVVTLQDIMTTVIVLRAGVAIMVVDIHDLRNGSLREDMLTVEAILAHLVATLVPLAVILALLIASLVPLDATLLNETVLIHHPVAPRRAMSLLAEPELEVGDLVHVPQPS
ncbi:hypothetical protein EIP91_005194 [Steccherinum ochraceum]|uniref:PH domain-containing protein n=1 Tax=Steccherinum ochraceum TaxID=92696 RepID=A0A4R0RA28_9APHY|nr:hypothetical protein EIP91_005194 [Steccherinum ochraceum]